MSFVRLSSAVRARWFHGCPSPFFDPGRRSSYSQARCYISAVTSQHVPTSLFSMTSSSEIPKQAIQNQTVCTSSESSMYTPIKSESQIRLLKILPGEAGTQVDCTLYSSDLLSSASDPFVALSYAWGHVDVSHTILINGQRLLVSKSVFDALHALRSLPSLDLATTGVWIDALCINQADPVEKTSQVRMMHKIYSAATTVMAWLGEDTGREAPGFTLIEKFVSAFELETIKPDQAPMSLRDEASTAVWAEAHNIPHVNHEAWDNVTSILLKPWFMRVWIIQETLFARELFFLCGSRLYPSHATLVALSHLNRLPWLQHALRNGGEFRSLPSIGKLEQVILAASSLGVARARMLAGVRGNLLSYLYFARRHEATDPRDKIFALVPASMDTDEQLIDYSLPLAEVLVSTAHHFLNQEVGCLDLLSVAQTFHRVEGVPSWVPCWSEKGDRYAELWLKYSSRVQGFPLRVPEPAVIDPTSGLMVTVQPVDYISSIPPHKSKYINDNPRILSRNSARLGSLEFTTNMTDDILSMIDGCEWRFKMAELTVEHLGAYPTGQPIEEVFWRSLIQDDQHELASKTITSYIETERQIMKIRGPDMLFQLMIPGGRLEGPPLSDAEIMSATNEYNNSLLENKRIAFEHDASIKPFETRWNLNRHMAFTKRGFVAWVPDTARVGDTIQILDGTRVPMLLRKHDDRQTVSDGLDVEKTDSTTFWELIGDVYLHGCMSGETSKMLELMGEDLEERQRIQIR